MDLAIAGHALVTGGGSGIGLGIVNAFAARDIKVTVVDVIRERLEEQFEGREHILALQLDTRDRAGWPEVKRIAEERFGPVDILVNNAGIGPDWRELVDTSFETFDQMVSVNLTAVFNGVANFAGDMKSRGKGHIVNVASLNGVIMGMAKMGGYATTKSGVVGMSEALREELAPHGVGVSVVCPGPVASRMYETARLLGTDITQQTARGGRDRMTGRTAGEIVLRAVELDLGHVFTHPAYFEAVEHRFAVMRDAAHIAAQEWPPGTIAIAGD
jgi:NAD(P)-dependent dehydrogenase (short-subunit alcohol dehydrogenase family)